VPFVLLVMALAEALDHGDLRLHALGGHLIAGRLVHAYDIGDESRPALFRISSIALTLAALVQGAVLNLKAATLPF